GGRVRAHSAARAKPGVRSQCAPERRSGAYLRFNLNGTACDTSAAAAEGSGLVGIIVAAGMHHDGMTRQIFELEMRGEHRRMRFPLALDAKRRQIAFLALVVGRSSVFGGAEWIEMPPGGHPRRRLAVLLRRAATAVSMDVEAMRSRRQSL